MGLRRKFKNFMTNYLNERGVLRTSEEILWSNIFRDTISDSDWLKNTSFSPGRSAIGYPFIYVLYRVLNEIKPQHILELGLGQSTRMIGQYVSAHANAEHFIVEHDPAWIEFFKRGFTLSERSNLVVLPLKEITWKNVENIITYEGLQKKFADKKFDFISIDGPFGFGSTGYSRIDTLTILPSCLSDSFVVMFDDCEREGEKQMINEFRNVLSANDIKFAEGAYSGQKLCRVIASENLKFVCTM